MSKFDEAIEQLVFGKESPSNSPALGLYLSPEIVYLAETHRGRDGKPAVDHLVRIPIPNDSKAPAGATATMSTDFLADPAKVAGVIRQSMSQLRWNSARVRVTLSHHLGLMRYFSMPAVEKRFMRSAVPLEAKKYIPIPFEQLAHDFQAVPLPPDASGKPRAGVLVAVTQKKNIANVQGLLDMLGLKLDGLEVAPISALRLWEGISPAEGPEPYMHVHIDNGSVRIMIAEKGMPVFFREVFLGGDAAVGDLRRIDLSGCLSFAQKQLGMAGVGSLRLSGNLPDLEPLREAFSQETGIIAELQDTPKLLSIKSGDWGGYAALGASAKTYTSSPLALDLGAPDRISDEEMRTARDIIVAGGVVAIALAASGIMNSGMYAFRARELNQYKISPELALSLQGKDNDMIQSEIRDMEKQLGMLRPITAVERPKLSLIVKEIIDAMPEKLWLSRISIGNPLMGADKNPLMLTLIGHAQDSSVADEQQMVFSFRDQLMKSSVLGNSFEIDIGISKQEQAASAVGVQDALDPNSLALRLEERTQFTLTMRSKR